MSNTFLENPEFSGKSVSVKPLAVQVDNPAPDKESRLMAAPENRPGCV